MTDEILTPATPSAMREELEALIAADVHGPAGGPNETASDVAQLRELHMALDHAVGAAYGWDDLALEHGCYETPQGRRFTVGPATKVEILGRLLELNHERYREELAKGLHAGPTRHRSARRRASGQGGSALL